MLMALKETWDLLVKSNLWNKDTLGTGQ
jgi:hypothetical protein